MLEGSLKGPFGGSAEEFALASGEFHSWQILGDFFEVAVGTHSTRSRTFLAVPCGRWGYLFQILKFFLPKVPFPGAAINDGTGRRAFALSSTG